MQKLLNPRSDLVIHKKVLKDNMLATICSGEVVQDLPVIGQCPDVPGYYSIGFPACTQKFSIPRKLTVKEISNGFNRLICELDYADAIPLENAICDYSDCNYIEEPIFP